MLRKTLLLAALTGFVGSAALDPAFSQGLPPDDFGFEIETAEEPKQESFLANLSQYFGATAGSNSGTSNAVDRSISAIAVQVDLPEFAGLKSAFNFDVGNYNNTYKFELSGSARQTLANCQQQVPNPNIDQDYQSLNAAERELYDSYWQNGCYEVYDEDEGAYLEPETERVVEDSFTELTEAYIQWEPTSFATIRLGRQPIVLGQFEVFSPLMFTTPMKARGTKTKTTKADLSYAQDGLQVSLFPTSQIELSFTSIPNMRLDPVNEKRFQEFALLKGDSLNFINDQVETLQDISDNDMSVARLVYYGNRLTLGLTAIQGVDTNEDPIREARLAPIGCEEFFDNDLPPAGSECAGGFAPVTDPFGNTFQQPVIGVPGSGEFDTYELAQDEGLRYGEMEAIAFEARLNLTSKLSFIYEVTMVEGEKELGILPFGGTRGEEPRAISPMSFQGDPNDPNFDPYAGSTRLLPFFDQVFNQNDAKPYINVETTMHSGGFIYQGDRLLINAQLAQRVQKGASELEEQLRKDLDWDTYYGEDTEENGSGASDILPIVNAVLLLGGEKQGFIGAGFGTFGQNFGFGLSGGWRFFEKLEIGAFGGMALDVTGADEIEAEGYDTPEDEGYVSFGVNYLF